MILLKYPSQTDNQLGAMGCFQDIVYAQRTLVASGAGNVLSFGGLGLTHHEFLERNRHFELIHLESRL